MTRKARRHLSGPGNTIPRAAALLGWREHVLRGALARGEIDYITINGRPRIPDREIERLKALFGPAPAEPVTAPAQATEPKTAPVLDEAELRVLRKLFGSAAHAAQLRELLAESEKSVV